ncbi:MAG: ATP--guanido phosphotransferase, partial [Elusimicrobia bacterium]|nr:ATP--guanido phosphotransferase [Elusimicrobiota bacterium]
MFQLANLLKNSAAWLSASGEESSVVVSSRVRLARNCTPWRYPRMAPPKELAAVFESIAAALKKTRELSKAAYIKMQDIDQIDRQMLVERHLISPDLLKELPHRGVVVSDKETISVMINEEDHLRLQALEPGLNVEGALVSALKIDGFLAKDLSYAEHEEMGFLTSCPTNVGTGMRASCLVHLPGLVASRHIESVLQEIARSGFAARGFYGEGSKVLGDLFQISNATTIGLSEEQLSRRTYSAVRTVLAQELKIRARLTKELGRSKATDRFWRSYAILRHGRLISYEEAMQAFST